MTSTGTVKNFNPMRGFGFITAGDGTDVFLHIKSVVDNKTPQQGDTVAFDIEQSRLKPGQMQAANVSGGSGGPTEGGPSGVVGTGTMQGQCKSFNPMKGYGFVVGPDGSDIFLHKNAMVDSSTPQAGDTITFDVEPSEKNPGTMQVTNATGGTGFDTKGKGKGKDKGMGKGMPDMWSMMQMMMAMKGGGGYGASKGGWGGGKGGPYGGKDGCKGKGMDKGGGMMAMGNGGWGKGGW